MCRFSLFVDRTSVHRATDLFREDYRISLRKGLFKLITLKPCDMCARIV